jgi:hypothetical protein
MSKTRKTRILGLTMSQFFILGCLALAAIGAIFGSFILISSSSSPGGLSIFPSPAPTLSVQATLPPELAGTSGPPATVPPVLIDNQIPPNWKQYTSATIEVWVPPQFQMVNPAEERLRRIESYRGGGYAFLADRLDQDTFDYRFWFNFPQPENPTYNTHIVVKADVLPTLTLDEYVDQAYGADLQGFQVLDRQELALGNLQARRLVMTASQNELSIGVAEYVITDEVNLWIISCGADVEEFYARLPDFDRVANSFKLLY